MSYEAGSKECRHLIEAKESLLSTLDALSNIHSTDLIQNLWLLEFPCISFFVILV